MPFGRYRKIRLASSEIPNELENQEVVATAEKLDAMGILHADWETYIDQAFFHEAYGDVEQIWKDLLAKSGLTVLDTLTHGTRNISFIEHVTDDV